MTDTKTLWPSYVINMLQNTTRMDNATQQLTDQNISFVRINGVDGRKLNKAQIDAAYDAAANKRRAKHPLVAPEIGCYLSHINAWRAIAEGEAAGGFVFEDDFQANARLHEVLLALSGDEATWDMVKLFAFKPAVPLAKARDLTPDHRIGFPYRVPTCLIGYGLTRYAAQHLLKRATPFFRPVDEDQKFIWETGLRVALVAPPPIRVGDQTAETGTIGDTRRAQSLAGTGAKLKQVWRGLWYALRYNFRLHTYKRKDRRP